MSRYSLDGTNIDYAVEVKESNAIKAVAITPNDSTTFTATKGLYIGGAGNIAVTMADGSAVTFTGVLAGTIYALSVKQVKATGTTATNLVAVY